MWEDNPKAFLKFLNDFFGSNKHKHKKQKPRKELKYNGLNQLRPNKELSKEYQADIIRDRNTGTLCRIHHLGKLLEDDWFKDYWLTKEQLKDLYDVKKPWFNKYFPQIINTMPNSADLILTKADLNKLNSPDYTAVITACLENNKLEQMDKLISKYIDLITESISVNDYIKNAGHVRFNDLDQNDIVECCPTHILVPDLNANLYCSEIVDLEYKPMGEAFYDDLYDRCKEIIDTIEIKRMYHDMHIYFNGQEYEEKFEQVKPILSLFITHTMLAYFQKLPVQYRKRAATNFIFALNNASYYRADMSNDLLDQLLKEKIYEVKTQVPFNYTTHTKVQKLEFKPANNNNNLLTRKTRL